MNPSDIRPKWRRALRPLLVRKACALLVVVASTVLATVVVERQPAGANSPGPIVNYGSGLCLQPYPVQAFPGQPVSIYDNGVRIAQVPCNGSPEQQWLPVWLGNDHNPITPGGGLGFPPLEPYYYVINYLTGKCLDVTDAHTNDQAEIQQFNCNGGGSEKWYQHPNPFGHFQYTNYRTGKCLDIPGATTGQTFVWQYRCTNDNVAQMFTFPP